MEPNMTRYFKVENLCHFIASQRWRTTSAVFWKCAAQTSYEKTMFRGLIFNKLVEWRAKHIPKTIPHHLFGVRVQPCSFSWSSMHFDHSSWVLKLRTISWNRLPKSPYQRSCMIIITKLKKLIPLIYQSATCTTMDWRWCVKYFFFKWDTRWHVKWVVRCKYDMHRGDKKGKWDHELSVHSG